MWYNGGYFEIVDQSKTFSKSEPATVLTLPRSQAARAGLIDFRSPGRGISQGTIVLSKRVSEKLEHLLVMRALQVLGEDFPTLDGTLLRDLWR